MGGRGAREASHLDSDGFEVVYEDEAAYLGREVVGSHPLHEAIFLIHLLTQQSTEGVKGVSPSQGHPPFTHHYGIGIKEIVLVEGSRLNYCHVYCEEETVELDAAVPLGLHEMVSCRHNP